MTRSTDQSTSFASKSIFLFALSAKGLSAWLSCDVMCMLKKHFFQT